MKKTGVCVRFWKESVVVRPQVLTNIRMNGFKKGYATSRWRYYTIRPELRIRFHLKTNTENYLFHGFTMPINSLNFTHQLMHFYI